MRTPGLEKDFLWLHLRELPYFRSLLRAVEARFYQSLPLSRPILDLGCGDGHFATVAFDDPLDVGLDPWGGPIRQARRRGGYSLTVQGYGDHLPFPNACFSSAISNSVLEHIAEIDPVLKEVSRVLKPGGLFIFCVPNHHFLSNLSVSIFLERFGLQNLAETYRRFFNRISRHEHCDPPEVWQARLEEAGFLIESWWHYFSPQALHRLEWGHYFGLPSLITHALFGRWILAPYRWNLALTRRIVQPYYDEPAKQSQGCYTFYVSRRI